MKSKILGLLAVGLLAGSMPAMAVPVTYYFSGHVNGIEDAAGALTGTGIGVGMPFRGTVMWDPDTAPTFTGPNPLGGTFSRYPESSSFRVAALLGGSRSFVSNTAYGQMFDDQDGLFGDGFDMISDNPSDFDAPVLGSRNLGFWAYDFSMSIFSTSASLPQALDLGDFDWVGFAVFSDDLNGNYYSIYGLITYLSLEPPPVPAPEPGTLALLGIGLAGLALSRRRKTA